MIENIVRCDGCKKAIADGAAFVAIDVRTPLPECATFIIHLCSAGCFEEWAGRFAADHLAPFFNPKPKVPPSALSGLSALYDYRAIKMTGIRV